MKARKGATLKLENGMEFHGFSFGYDGPSDGEVVFSTAMVGYPESLTDPSYSGQILCVTYPLIGNYGVPQEGSDQLGISLNFESEKIWVRGLVISDYSFDYSHWDAVKSLDEWLKEQKIPGIFGIDTRALTQILREKGSMLGMIVPDGTEKDFPSRLQGGNKVWQRRQDGGPCGLRSQAQHPEVLRRQGSNLAPGAMGL